MIILAERYLFIIIDDQEKEKSIKFNKKKSEKKHRK
jgi:hypothetical protein